MSMIETLRIDGRQGKSWRGDAAGKQREGSLWSSSEEICRMLGLPVEGGAQLPTLFQRMRMDQGRRLNIAGSRFENLYLVNAGHLKSVVVDEGGEENVVGFPMRGDLIGADGIAAAAHTADAVSLTDCDLVKIPFAQISALGRSVQCLEGMLISAMSRELARRRSVISLLSNHSAEARLARFLIMLAGRYNGHGEMNEVFTLPMTRGDIGQYLGLSLETVSRNLNLLQRAAFIELDGRKVRIPDVERLARLRRFAPPFLRRYPVKAKGKDKEQGGRVCGV